MRDFGLEAQKAAEAHWFACEEARWDYEEEELDVPSPASTPYCGCTTCQIREILFAAWPILLEAAREELADAVGAEQEDQPQRHRDGDQTDVTGSECHAVRLPSRADVQA